ncbi:hypothetical protein Ddc_18961 [Ditylenchus destructor]|nr:hypothetical protein Ddc_18961 [Ditylenchus destructor]
MPGAAPAAAEDSAKATPVTERNNPLGMAIAVPGGVPRACCAPLRPSAPSCSRSRRRDGAAAKAIARRWAVACMAAPARGRGSRRGWAGRSHRADRCPAPARGRAEVAARRAPRWMRRGGRHRVGVQRCQSVVHGWFLRGSRASIASGAPDPCGKSCRRGIIHADEKTLSLALSRKRARGQVLSCKRARGQEGALTPTGVACPSPLTPSPACGRGWGRGSSASDANTDAHATAAPRDRPEAARAGHLVCRLVRKEATFMNELAHAASPGSPAPIAGAFAAAPGPAPRSRGSERARRSGGAAGGRPSARPARLPPVRPPMVPSRLRGLRGRGSTHLRAAVAACDAGGRALLSGGAALPGGRHRGTPSGQRGRGGAPGDAHPDVAAQADARRRQPVRAAGERAGPLRRASREGRGAGHPAAPDLGDLGGLAHALQQPAPPPRGIGTPVAGRSAGRGEGKGARQEDA